LSISKHVDIMRVMKRATDPDVRLLQAAADPTRLAILRQLAAVEGVCACDFSDCCDVAQPTVSHHLKVLREAGWVRSERRASFIYYYLRPEAVERFGALAGEFAPAFGLPPARQLPVIQPLA
jgi:ArsR family transcriptional regulator, arsenate/arsenite/antimonite-responsive transcriptional repressor